MIATSSMSGTFISSEVPGANNVAAISLRTEFLAPGTATAPVSGDPPSILNTDTTQW
jgi:hypothetical protein